jgi:hypothetical protein
VLLIRPDEAVNWYEQLRIQANKKARRSGPLAFGFLTYIRPRGDYLPLIIFFTAMAAIPASAALAIGLCNML